MEYETLTGGEIQKVINGEPLNKGDDSGDTGDRSGGTPSITAIHKLKPKSKPSGDMEPEPSA